MHFKKLFTNFLFIALINIQNKLTIDRICAGAFITHAAASRQCSTV